MTTKEREAYARILLVGRELANGLKFAIRHLDDPDLPTILRLLLSKAEKELA